MPTSTGSYKVTFATWTKCIGGGQRHLRIFKDNSFLGTICFCFLKLKCF